MCTLMTQGAVTARAPFRGHVPYFEPSSVMVTFPLTESLADPPIDVAVGDISALARHGCSPVNRGGQCLHDSAGRGVKVDRFGGGKKGIEAAGAP